MKTSGILKIVLCVICTGILTNVLGSVGLIFGLAITVIMVFAVLKEEPCIWRFQWDTNGYSHAMSSCEKGWSAHYALNPHIDGHEGQPFKFCVNCGHPIKIVDISRDAPSIIPRSRDELQKELL